MDKVKIKRVKRNKKEITTKEKVLAGLGLGSTLLGGAGVVAPKPTETQFVRTQTNEDGTSKSRVKETLGKIFGIQKAKAAEDSFANWENQARADLDAGYFGEPGSAGYEERLSAINNAVDEHNTQTPPADGTQPAPETPAVAANVASESQGDRTYQVGDVDGLGHVAVETGKDGVTRVYDTSGKQIDLSASEVSSIQTAFQNASGGTGTGSTAGTGTTTSGDSAAGTVVEPVSGADAGDTGSGNGSTAAPVVTNRTTIPADQSPNGASYEVGNVTGRGLVARQVGTDGAIRFYDSNGQEIPLTHDEMVALNSAFNAATNNQPATNPAPANPEPASPEPAANNTSTPAPGLTDNLDTQQLDVHHGVSVPGFGQVNVSYVNGHTVFIDHAGNARDFDNPNTILAYAGTAEAAQLVNLIGAPSAPETPALNVVPSSITVTNITSVSQDGRTYLTGFVPGYGNVAAETGSDGVTRYYDSNGQEIPANGEERAALATAFAAAVPASPNPDTSTGASGSTANINVDRGDSAWANTSKVVQNSDGSYSVVVTVGGQTFTSPSFTGNPWDAGNEAYNNWANSFNNLYGDKAEKIGQDNAQHVFADLASIRNSWMQFSTGLNMNAPRELLVDTSGNVTSVITEYGFEYLFIPSSGQLFRRAVGADGKPNPAGTWENAVDAKDPHVQDVVNLFTGQGYGFLSSNIHTAGTDASLLAYLFGYNPQSAQQGMVVNPQAGNGPINVTLPNGTNRGANPTASYHYATTTQAERLRSLYPGSTIAISNAPLGMFTDVPPAGTFRYTITFPGGRTEEVGAVLLNIAAGGANALNSYPGFAGFGGAAAVPGGTAATTPENYHYGWAGGSTVKDGYQAGPENISDTPFGFNTGASATNPNQLSGTATVPGTSGQSQWAYQQVPTGTTGGTTSGSTGGGTAGGSGTGSGTGTFTGSTGSGSGATGTTLGGGTTGGGAGAGSGSGSGTGTSGSGTGTSNSGTGSGATGGSNGGSGGSTVTDTTTVQLRQEIAVLQNKIDELNRKIANQPTNTVVVQSSSEEIRQLRNEVSRLTDQLNRQQSGSFTVVAQSNQPVQTTGLQMPPGYPASEGGLRMPPGYPASEGYVAPSVQGAETGRTYVVKKGDTLWSIAKRYYGDGRQWRKILEANTDKVKNPRTMRVGIELVIPDR